MCLRISADYTRQNALYLDLFSVIDLWFQSRVVRDEFHSAATVNFLEFFERRLVIYESHNDLTVVCRLSGPYHNKIAVQDSAIFHRIPVNAQYKAIRLQEQCGQIDRFSLFDRLQWLPGRYLSSEW